MNSSRFTFAFTIITNLVIANGQLGENEKSAEDSTAESRQGNADVTTWKSVSGDVTYNKFLRNIPSKIEQTYQRCINETAITDTYTYINLTQVVEAAKLDIEFTEISACFYLCQKTDPSTYISIQNPFQNSVHSCGCHNEIDLLPDIQFDKKYCEEQLGYFAIYCGPTNVQCLNSSSSISATFKIIFFILLFIIFNTSNIIL